MKRHARVFNSFLTLCLLVALCFAPGAAAQDAGPYRLRLNLEEGATYRVTVVNERQIDQEIQGRTMENASTDTLTYIYDVVEVSDDGVMTVEMTYEQTGAENGPRAALVGQSVTFRITPAGEVVEVQGVQALLDSMFAAMEAPNEQAAAMMKERLKGQFGPDALRSSVGKTFAFYPDEPVGIGDSWTAQYRIESIMPIQVQATYTLESVENGVATLGVDATMTSPSDSEPVQMGPAELDIAVDGAQNGTLRVDLATGFPMEIQYMQDLSGEGEVVVGKAPPNIRVIPMTMAITGTTTVTAERVE